MKIKDIMAMIKNGILPETIHQMHGNSITCPICEKEMMKRQLSFMTEEASKTASEVN